MSRTPGLPPTPAREGQATPTDSPGTGTPGLSMYESRRWGELQEHWGRGQRRPVIPAQVRRSFGAVGTRAADLGGRAAQKVAAAAPESARDAAGTAIGATLAPTVRAVVHLLDVVTDWSVELTDPDRVLQHHRERGRPVASTADLRALDLEHLDEVTRHMPLRWRTLGAAEGAAMGALAFIPVAGGVVSISLDLLVVHVLTTSIATRTAHAYGFDPSSPATEAMIDRMVRRAYHEQQAKVVTQRQAGSAFTAAAGRQRWSKKLREDHRILAAVETLMKRAGSGPVPVTRVARVMPAIAVIAGAGSNAHLLGDVAEQAIRYSQTVFLCDKHGLPLPPRLRDDHTPDDQDDMPA